ncbi:uncharacterized protein DUF1906 [Actinophytocola oryzae]|uniref:Uncharacterized protein DUF1906 n=1 Tax=Actinophytocola oryzae TaxID=502181 RepID=A0A4R7VX35_9PSEU|nr:uncharacterized protein DUF1906 [Actinophytocola oryzae]
MAHWLDYSANRLHGTTIKNAGYTGVIRYIDSPTRLATKHTDQNEYRSHLAAGLAVLLVMQTTTTASDGGFSVGRAHARRALAGADHLGYQGPIFFTNDRTTLPNPSAWKSYLDGAASVLGIGRVGAYGFRNAMDVAVGHATYFWQAGRRSDVAPHTHIWQDNNTQVKVGGITCDRNLVLKGIGSVGGFLMSLSDEEQRDLFDRIFGMLRQRYFAKDDEGAVVEVGGDHPGATPATVLDSLDGNFLVNMIEVLDKRVTALEVAGVDVDRLATLLAPAVAKAVNDEFARRQNS